MKIKWPGNTIGEYTDKAIEDCIDLVECSFCGKYLKAGYHCSDNFIIPVVACDDCIDSYNEWKQKNRKYQCELCGYATDYSILFVSHADRCWNRVKTTYDYKP